MPLQATSGAASYDGFGGGVVAEPNYIESCFSTYLYTGNGSTTTINNGIDVSGEGGLVWVKARANGNRSHTLFDSATYTTGQYYLATNITNGFLDTGVAGTFALNNSGFSVSGTSAQWNASGESFASWTFRKQPKFFDVVTYSGNSTAGRTVAHNLGSVPGCMIVKDLLGGPWYVYHQSLGNTQTLVLNSSTNAGTDPSWNNTTPTSTVFTLGDNYQVNYTGHDYVAYLFAHDAGGFGLTGTDNVISCGSYVGTEARLPITLGYEPQWVMIKDASTGGAYKDWYIFDNMRKLDVSNSGNAPLLANSSAAEGGTYASSAYNLIQPTSTGMIIDPSSQGPSAVNTSGDTYIYIAIRRGPMKVPTSGTSVFIPVSATPSGATTVTTNFPVDLAINAQRDSGTSGNKVFWDRLRGSSTSAGQGIFSNLTNAEVSYSGNGIGLQSNTTIVDNFWNTLNGATTPVIYWNFKRAPSFFDEVCYTGTGSQQNITHNLGVAPELMIVKRRSAAGGSWATWATSLTADQSLALNTTDDKTAVFSVGFWGSTYPTSSVFTVGSNVNTNSNTVTYVAYLFATCAGVSKVFSYTGNGSSQTINCGFTAGARWILIKRTDSTGDWYVWDSAKGIVSGNDPHLSLNTTAAEVTTDDTIDTDSTGFVVNQVSATNVNVSSATYIGIAIA